MSAIDAAENDPQHISLEEAAKKADAEREKMLNTPLTPEEYATLIGTCRDFCKAEMSGEYAHHAKEWMRRLHMIWSFSPDLPAMDDLPSVPEKEGGSESNWWKLWQLYDRFLRTSQRPSGQEKWFPSKPVLALVRDRDQLWIAMLAALMRTMRNDMRLVHKVQETASIAASKGMTVEKILQDFVEKSPENKALVDQVKRDMEIASYRGEDG